jgi:hypothetical protein
VNHLFDDVSWGSFLFTLLLAVKKRKTGVGIAGLMDGMDPWSTAIWAGGRKERLSSFTVQNAHGH